MSIKVGLFLFAAGSILRFNEESPIQPSHFVTAIVPVVLLVLFGTRRGLQMPTRGQAAALGACIGFFFVNLVHFMLNGWPVSQVVAVTFWPLAALYVYTLSLPAFEPYMPHYVRYMGFWLTISLAAAAVELVVNFPTRPAGLSGTPNHIVLQIVHYQLLSLALKRRSGFIVQQILGLLSLSRAYAAFLFLSLMSGRRGLKIAGLMVVILLAAIPFLGDIDQFLSGKAGDFLAERFSLEGNTSDESGRGITRVLLHPHYLLIGAGELDIHFEGDPFPGQIHNNFLSLSFCFGIIGIAFSSWFLVKLRERVGTWMAFVYFVFSLGLYFYNNIVFLSLVAILAAREVRRE